MHIIKPKKLQLGDMVGIISPSEPVTQDLRKQFDQAVLQLESWGLNVKLGKHVFDQYYYNAGTKEARLEDFHTIWQDPEVEMVLMSQGGETANHLLGGIDYQMIKDKPKILAGISDGTTLVNAVFAKTGLVTYHGPDLVYMFGRKISQPFKDNFFKTFFEGQVGQLLPNPNWQHQEKPELTHQGWRCLRGGKAQGILVGGHAGCLITTMLAGYTPDFTETILFLEGTDDIAHLDRQLTALKLNGVFEKINGLVIGWFEWSELKDKDKNRQVRDVILEVTQDYSFPILEIGELGHNVENYIFPIGCQASLDADNKYLAIDEKTVI